MALDRTSAEIGPMRTSRGWIVVAALVVVGGWILRAWHLGTTSLWWDEMVQIRMVDAPSLWAVVTRVRLGVPAGSGNAGAVPLDYVLLWAWTHTVALPAPERLEVYFRTPSFLWSCLLPPILGWWAWRRAGASSGLATLVLASASVPLLLYAAEARFYSLFCFMTVVNLATFTTVLERPDEVGPWIRYGVSAVLLFLTGLFGLLVLPWQLVTLALAPSTNRSRYARRRLLAIGLTLGAFVAVYYASTNLGTRSLRGPTRIAWGATTLATLRFFGFGSSGLPWLLGLAPFVAIATTWRRSRLLGRVATCYLLAAATALPIMFELAELKQHFFHPRHALFLLPPLLALLGIAVGTVAEALVSRRRAPWVAIVATAALSLPAVRSYAASPHFYFDRTKALHEFREVTQELRRRTDDYGPNDRYLLISTRGKGGQLGNPVLAWYLEWYGIRDRVLLTGTTTPAETIRRARDACQVGCRQLSALTMKQLRLTSAFQVTPAKRRLLAAPVSQPLRHGDPRHIGFLVYPPLARWHLGPLQGYRPWRRRGLHLYQLTRPPWRPRSPRR